MQSHRKTSSQVNIFGDQLGKSGVIGAADIGGTKIAVGVVDAQGRVLYSTEAPTNPEGEYAKARDIIIEMLSESACRAGVKIEGIGIGCTGPVLAATGEIGAVNFFPGWCGSNPVADLTSAFKVSVAIENDADAAALGELLWGAGRGKRTLIYVTVGTGIGAGLILHGELYRGVDYSHPEIGHHLIDPSGPACTCGFRGCWESLAAGPAMSAWFEANVPADYPYRDDTSAKRICELAALGDSLARRALEREAYYLRAGLANLITLFSPEAIVLGGGVMKSASLLLPGIVETVRTSCRYVPAEKTNITLASLGEHANLIGAAGVWYYHFAPERRPCVS